jgi:uncharacterized protein (TIGR02453 family)
VARRSDRQFGGFPKDFFAFFEELARNNERPWFMANKARYESSVLAPMTSLVADMAPPLGRISRHYVADPKRSLFRIYRDVRFSRDKRPYKEHCAAQFRHAAGRDVHAPGFYVHLAPDEIFMGGGMWMPDATALKRVRDAIVRDTAGWRRAQDKRFRDVYGGLSDEYSLKRAPKGYDPDHPAIADIKRTSFVFSHESTRGRASKAAFLDEIEDAFTAARPIMRFLCKALDLPF